MPRWDWLTVIYALGKRDLRRYFSNPTGYVFITLFILLSAAAAFWRPRFFLNSLANLDQLSETFPYLLLFFIPALTMGIWADERKQGTDELLLTLPAHEHSIVLGKYLAAAGVYTVALTVSLSHVVVLAWLGDPDGGLLTANYLGFWLAGASLIPVAMLASLLTANVTIAFIFGSLLCAVPVGMSEAAATASASLGQRLASFGIPRHFGDFARGILGLDDALYFAFLAGLFLYLNVLVLQRRHWRRRPGALPMPLHATVRAVALALALGSIVVLAGRTHARLDLTAERLSSPSAETEALVAGLPADRAVIIRAFVSPEIPQPLVQTRENVLGLLREIGARGGARITVAIEETEPYSDQARLARERYNIFPRAVSDSNTGETAPDVYLGAAVTSGADEQVIPFFDPGLSPEYEIARAIRVVTRAERKRIGILDADVKMLGGIDSRTNQPRPEWAAVQELRKQYDIVEVTPADAAHAQVDALVVVLPSRMTQTDLDLALEPIKRGVPTLMLLDPLPMIDLHLAPAADLASQIDPFRPAAAARLVFGDIRTALGRFGLNWVPAGIVWDGFNPHPDLANLSQETVFVGDGNGNPNALNRQNPATAGLQEVLLLYPGYVLQADSSDLTFEPLLQTGRVSGSSSFFDVVTPTPSGMAINAGLTREPDGRQYVLAARVRSKHPLSPEPGARPTDLVVIADLDFISNAFFDIRAMGTASAIFDNITFFLNTIDVLAGDESFIAMRNRRPRHRTLKRLEAQTRTFMDRRTQEEQQAQKEALAALGEARNRLTKRVEALDARTDLDAQARQILVRNVEEAENRELGVLERSIAAARDAKIHASRETMEGEIRRIRTRIRSLAVLLPPVPVLLIGVAVFIRRMQRERDTTRAAGRMREAP
jgi:gliding motility-associated transport system permease protein/gliding motility-associatede transport system auxiliary component